VDNASWNMVNALEALTEVHGQEKPDGVGLGEWMWGALQGDFNQERSVGQIGFDMVISLIPIVDTVMDLQAADDTRGRQRHACPRRAGRFARVAARPLLAPNDVRYAVHAI
jgi:hypothetical protein